MWIELAGGAIGCSCNGQQPVPLPPWALLPLLPVLPLLPLTPPLLPPASVVPSSQAPSLLNTPAPTTGTPICCSTTGIATATKQGCFGGSTRG